MEYQGSKGMGYEYEAQLFGFTPRSFVDGIYNAVTDYIADCFAELENVLNSEPELCRASTPEETREATERAMASFYKSSDNTFDRFELYVMENIFKIPANALLPEDKIVAKFWAKLQDLFEHVEDIITITLNVHVHEGHQYTAEEEELLDSELRQLQQRIKAAKYVNTALKQEIKDLDQAQKQMEIYEEWWDRAHKVCQTTTGALKEHLEFSSVQANKLSNTLKNLTGVKDIHTPSESNEEPDDVSISMHRKKMKL